MPTVSSEIDDHQHRNLFPADATPPFLAPGPQSDKKKQTITTFRGPAQLLDGVEVAISLTFYRIVLEN